MRISIACDHGAFDLKERLKAHLLEQGHQVTDCGTHSGESCDYPDFAAAAARLVADGSCERGVVLCTTGIGMSIAANKVKGVRCALCHEPLSAEMTTPQRRQCPCHGGGGHRREPCPADPGRVFIHAV